MDLHLPSPSDDSHKSQHQSVRNRTIDKEA